jgi:hypothetical protein
MKPYFSISITFTLEFNELKVFYKVNVNELTVLANIRVNDSYKKAQT